MLEIIKNLPKEVLGINAHKKITAEDYDTTIIPLLNEAHEKGRKINFLYNFCSDFEGFTPGAAWQDFKVGMRHLRLFEKCAIITDKDWLSKSTDFFGAMIPCTVRCFQPKQYEEAIEWLSAHETKNLTYTFDRKNSLLILEPKQPLDSQDFDALSAEIDPWIEQEGQLNGLIIQADHFPGWENLGSMVRHIQFVKNHHKKIKKVAFCADGKILEILPSVAKHFVNAEIKHFATEELEDAKSWILS